MANFAPLYRSKHCFSPPAPGGLIHLYWFWDPFQQVGFPHSSKQFSDTISASYNSIPTLLPRESVRSHRLKAQSHMTAPTSGTNLRGPQPPPWVRLICWSGSQDSGETFSLLDYWYIFLTGLQVYYEDITQEQPDGRDAQGEEWGQGSALPSPWTSALPPSTTCLPTGSSPHLLVGF